MIMAAVCIGTIAQIVDGETRSSPGPDVTTSGKHAPVDVTTSGKRVPVAGGFVYTVHVKPLAYAGKVTIEQPREELSANL